MSLGVGLRAKELTSLKWADVYDAEGRVRPVLHLRAAYTKGSASDSLVRVKRARVGAKAATCFCACVWRGTPIFVSKAAI